MDVCLTMHARKRAQQRGIRSEQMRILTAFADTDVKVARSLHAMRTSRRALAEARAEGLPAAAIDRLSGIVLVESAGGALVTCAHLIGRRSGVYRRPRRKFWRS